MKKFPYLYFFTLRNAYHQIWVIYKFCTRIFNLTEIIAEQKMTYQNNTLNL